MPIAIRWSWILLCIILSTLGFSGRAFAQNNQVDSLNKRLEVEGLDSNRVKTLNRLAITIAYTDYAQALKLYEESYQLSKSLHYERGLKVCYAGLSELQNWLGNYSKSMEHAQNAFSLAEKENDSASLGRIMVSIGLINLNLSNYKNAIKSFEKAREYYGPNNRYGQLVALHNMASAKSGMGDTLAAKKQYLQNMEVMREHPYNNILAATYNNLGRLFHPRTEGDSAIAYFEKALELKRIDGNPSSISNTELNIVEVLLAQGNYKKAEQMLNELRATVEATQVLDRKMQFHKMSGRLYRALKKFEQASYHFEQLAMFQDSLYEPQMVEQAARTEASFNSERKQQQIELLNAAKKVDEIDKKRLRWILAAIVIGLIVALVMLIIMVIRSRERNRILKLLREKNEEIKRQQQEILLSNEALALQNLRLEDLNREKDGLIGIVAHDIRAPLIRTAALVELIRVSGELNENQLRFTNMIKKVTEDGGRLIQDLLELNSYEGQNARVELKDCNISELVQVVLHGYGSVAEKKEISLEYVANEDLPLVQTDEKLLARILDNLISNAIKFTPPKKKVEILIHSNEKGITISIRDEGPGISEEEQKKMFQKFMRLSPQPTGGESSTGLGLSIVKTLTNQIGAEIEVNSIEGQGSTFSVILFHKKSN